MSNITIELRPPPNVDFVHGFPGIPPAGPERPQAAVKGAIEVRVPQTGVKAKWVRIELRKVEVLPPGGEPNTYWDCIGPNPVNLWTATDEYGVLRTQDFPFSIRIPESIPPSVDLDNRACISYELVASVCTKGKRGFLRKAKSVVSTSRAPITIDKHELHSTWPIYNQPEIRHMAQDGINLMVERNNTCFGPGDRVVVNVTVKSDSLHTVILRGFEIALKETTVLRASPHGTGRRTQPLSKMVSIAENKVMLNATMYGGQQKQAELACTLSPKHTTPTLNAARHIDVTYTLMVKAVMGTGDNLVMDLPVIISNWQRDISLSAIGQIGPTPNLSNLPITSLHNVQGFTANTSIVRTPAPTSTLPAEGRGAHGRQGGGGINMFATANPAGATEKSSVDEFGYSSASAPAAAATVPSSLARPTIPPINTGTTVSPRPTSRGNTGTTTNSRPTSRGNASNRLTVTNAHPSELSSEENAGGSSNRQQQQQQPQQNRSDSGGKQWLSAEEEKKLYEQARKRVENLQGPHAAPAPFNRTSPPPTAVSTASVTSGGGSSAVPTSQMNSASERPWMTAEEEKTMLFNKAQAAVARNQGIAGPPAPATGGGSASSFGHHRTPSDHAVAGGSSTSPAKPTGVQMYQQAMLSRKNPPPTQAAALSNNSSPATPYKASSVPVYPTAEQEKAAYRRYEEARQAVGRTQGNVEPSSSGGGGMASPERDSAGPIAYEALFPNGGGAGGGSTSGSEPPPPPFGASPAPSPAAGHIAILSEKERLKREYEARDTAALAAQANVKLQRNESYGSPPPPSFTSAPPPPFTPSAPAPTQYANAIAEKEALRRKFEAQDRAAAAVLPPPAPLQTPSRNSSSVPGSKSQREAGGGSYISPLSTTPRPTPNTPPVAAPTGGTSRIMTAAEEKALLRAKYETQDIGGAAQRAPPPPLQPKGLNGGVNGRSGKPPPPFSANVFGSGAPPPLMPRPPVEYIRETRQEDARFAEDRPAGGAVNGNGNALNGVVLNVEVKPFAPFNAELRSLPPN